MGGTGRPAGLLDSGHSNIPLLHVYFNNINITPHNIDLFIVLLKFKFSTEDFCRSDAPSMTFHQTCYHRSSNPLPSPLTLSQDSGEGEGGGGCFHSHLQ